MFSKGMKGTNSYSAVQIGTVTIDTPLPQRKAAAEFECRLSGRGIGAEKCGLETHRSTGSLLILTPFSVAETIAPFSTSSLQICRTVISSRERSSPRNPSMRIRITDGPVSPEQGEQRVEIGIECDDDHTLLTTALENRRIRCCCQSFVAHVCCFDALLAKVNHS